MQITILIGSSPDSITPPKGQYRLSDLEELFTIAEDEEDLRKYGKLLNCLKRVRKKHPEHAGLRRMYAEKYRTYIQLKQLGDSNHGD